jgi:hypothetical protein
MPALGAFPVGIGNSQFCRLGNLRYSRQGCQRYDQKGMGNSSGSTAGVSDRAQLNGGASPRLLGRLGILILTQPGFDALGHILFAGGTSQMQGVFG